MDVFLVLEAFQLTHTYLCLFVQDIHHERAWLHSRVDQVVVKCVVETTGREHSDRLIRTLRERGYPVTREDP